MKVYTTENEQIAAIKLFFIDKGKVLLIMLLILIGTIIGWHYYQLREVNTLQENAQSFEQISFQLQTGSNQAMVAAKQFADKTNNIYGVLTNIELATIAAEKNDLAGAEKALLKALTITKIDNLKNLLNIRLARVQLALNNTYQALISLSQVQDKGWGTIVEDIRGDILLKKGDIAGARAAYFKGIESSGAKMMKLILKMKINSLPN